MSLSSLQVSSLSAGKSLALPSLRFSFLGRAHLLTEIPRSELHSPRLFTMFRAVVEPSNLVLDTWFIHPQTSVVIPSNPVTWKDGRAVQVGLGEWRCWDLLHNGPNWVLRDAQADLLRAGLPALQTFDTVSHWQDLDYGRIFDVTCLGRIPLDHPNGPSLRYLDEATWTLHMTPADPEGAASVWTWAEFIDAAARDMRGDFPRRVKGCQPGPRKGVADNRMMPPLRLAA